jgi:hypothetical protein
MAVGCLFSTKSFEKKISKGTCGSLVLYELFCCRIFKLFALGNDAEKFREPEPSLERMAPEICNSCSGSSMGRWLRRQ